MTTLDTAQDDVKIGAMICYDREFPESARILMLKGAEIILTPNACDARRAASQAVPHARLREYGRRGDGELRRAAA